MPKLVPQAKKEEMLRLLAEGVSINNTSRELSLAKSTIYHHYKKMNGKKYQEPVFDTLYSELEGEIVGIFAGDGSLHFEPKKYHYEGNIHSGNETYLEYVKKLFESYFGKTFRVQEESLGRARLRTYDKKIFCHFWNYLDFDETHKHDTVRLKSMEFSDEFNIGFLRGLLDTDGTICLAKDSPRPRIVCYTTSEQLAKQIKALLGKFNIEANIAIKRYKEPHKKDYYHIYLLASGKSRFINLMKPFKARRLGPVV